MSKSEVSSFSEFGPYRTFSNGDIETFAGIYDGKKENVQFFFDARGLRRIGVYLYEGLDIQEARVAWRRAYESLVRNYGEVETPDIRMGERIGSPPADGSAPSEAEILSLAAAVNVDVVGKTQMAPIVQPKDMFVFSSFWRHQVQGKRFFYVTINIDRRP